MTRTAPSATLALLLTLLGLSAGFAAEPEKTFDDGGNLSELKTNKTSGRKYLSFEWDAKNGQLLTLASHSSDHTPEIIVYALDFAGKPMLMNGEPAARSKAATSYVQNGRRVFACDVQYRFPANRRYKIVVTHVGDKQPGKFTYVGYIEKPAAPPMLQVPNESPDGPLGGIFGR